MAQTDSKTLTVTKLLLKGYKSIIDCEFELQKGLNIIIGKNGSGKSNLFEFVENVVSAYPKEVNFREAEFNLRSDDGNVFRLYYEKSILDTEFSKENPNSRFQINRKLFINGEKKAEGLLDGVVIDPIEFKLKTLRLKLSLNQFFNELKYIFPYSINLQFHIPYPLPFVENSGVIKLDVLNHQFEFPLSSNFLNFLIWDAEAAYIENEISYEGYQIDTILNLFKIDSIIKENLASYSPIKNLRFSKNAILYKGDLELIVDNLKLEFYVNDTWLPWSQLSDGTKRLFYLISEITTKDSGLILIEEPELGIHPHQFSLLMDFIKQQSETKQILISTHSPKALDHLDKNELGNILIASYEKGKGTQVRNLTAIEKDKASKYMDEVAFLSDYWLLSNLEE